MPKDIGLKKNLPEIMSRPVYEIMLNAWVESRLVLSPAFSIQASIQSFFDYFGITQDDWDINTAMQSFYNHNNDCASMKKNNLNKNIEKWKNQMTS